MKPPRLALAVVAALSILLSACGQETPPKASASESPTPAPSSRSITPEPTPSSSSSGLPTSPRAPVKVSVEGARTGSPPNLDYLRHDAGGWVLVSVGGQPVPVAQTYDDFVPFEDGFVGLRISAASTVDVVDGTGKVTHSEDAMGYRLAATPDGQMVGWLRPGGVPVDYEVATDEVLTGPKVTDATDLAALDGEKTCDEATSPVHGCFWLVIDADNGRTWGASSHGIVDRLPGVGTASDIDSDGYVVGITSTSDLGSCSALLRPWRKPRWETCDFRLRTFSPDATRVSATNAYGDGLGDTQVALLGRDGTVQQEFRAARGVNFMKEVWEDEDHLLVLTYGDDGWAGLRLGVDGSVEVAVPPISGDDGQARLVLPSR
jgi:hypothetical protein